MGSAEVDVHTGTLLFQEKIWADQAKRMGNVVAQIRNSQCELYAGVFADAVNSYNMTCEMMAGLCGGGEFEMDRIAKALIDSHRTYSEAEERILAQIKYVIG
ncbi:MAG: hypothetical protein J2P25_12945 [Nocardiopsaceae bacterium]|nr:hypothetical protein [Nocardiopsaceae bacterium]